MNLEAAVRAVAPAAPPDAAAGLARLDPVSPALATRQRTAHLIGQCAHESARFTRQVESLYYRSGDRIFAVFGRRHFAGIADAEEFARNPSRLANRVYANRMGNGDEASGDGFRFRGRGWLQLTGRGNYRRFGSRIGIDLEAEPDRAAESTIAWRIAADYLASRRRAGKTALEWADLGNVEMVTRIVNGGIHGLGERRMLTVSAMAALDETALRIQLARGDDGPAVERLQGLLIGRGLSPGAIDGDFGPKTEAALRDFQRASGLPATGRVDAATWAALEQGVA